MKCIQYGVITLFVLVYGTICFGVEFELFPVVQTEKEVYVLCRKTNKKGTRQGIMVTSTSDDYGARVQAARKMLNDDTLQLSEKGAFVQLGNTPALVVYCNSKQEQKSTKKYKWFTKAEILKKKKSHPLQLLIDVGGFDSGTDLTKSYVIDVLLMGYRGDGFYVLFKKKIPDDGITSLFRTMIPISNEKQFNGINKESAEKAVLASGACQSCIPIGLFGDCRYDSGLGVTMFEKVYFMFTNDTGDSTTDLWMKISDLPGKDKSYKTEKRSFIDPHSIDFIISKRAEIEKAAEAARVEFSLHDLSGALKLAISSN